MTKWKYCPDCDINVNNEKWDNPEKCPICYGKLEDELPAFEEALDTPPSEG